MNLFDLACGSVAAGSLVAATYLAVIADRNAKRQGRHAPLDETELKRLTQQLDAYWDTLGVDTAGTDVPLNATEYADMDHNDLVRDLCTADLEPHEQAEIISPWKLAALFANMLRAHETNTGEHLELEDHEERERWERHLAHHLRAEGEVEIDNDPEDLPIPSPGYGIDAGRAEEIRATAGAPFRGGPALAFTRSDDGR